MLPFLILSEWVCYKSRLLQDGQHGGLVPHGLLPGCSSDLWQTTIPWQRKVLLSWVLGGKKGKSKITERNEGDSKRRKAYQEKKDCRESYQLLFASCLLYLRKWDFWQRKDFHPWLAWVQFDCYSYCNYSPGEEIFLWNISGLRLWDKHMKECQNDVCYIKSTKT